MNTVLSNWSSDQLVRPTDRGRGGGGGAITAITVTPTPSDGLVYREGLTHYKAPQKNGPRLRELALRGERNHAT